MLIGAENISIDQTGIRQSIAKGVFHFKQAFVATSNLKICVMELMTIEFAPEMRIWQGLKMPVSQMQTGVLIGCYMVQKAQHSM